MEVLYPDKIKYFPENLLLENKVYDKAGVYILLCSVSYEFFNKSYCRHIWEGGGVGAEHKE